MDAREAPSEIAERASTGAGVFVGSLGIQRSRILNAVVEVVFERGLSDTSVGLVASRAGVSTRTFYHLFEGVEGCLLAVLSATLERVVELASQALECEQTWRDGLRSALASVLAFFDSEPGLARICLVESLAGSPRLLESRMRIVEASRRAVIGRVEGEVSHASPLAAEGGMALVLGVVHARLIEPDRRPLVELVGPLMGVLVALFVDDVTVAHEIALGDELARAVRACSSGPPLATGGLGPAARSLWAAPCLAGGRARECLLHLANNPDASNREVATGIGVNHPSQISRLLAHLAAEGLVVKRSEGVGKRNACRLTPRGAEMAQALMQRRS